MRTTFFRGEEPRPPCTPTSLWALFFPEPTRTSAFPRYGAAFTKKFPDSDKQFRPASVLEDDRTLCELMAALVGQNALLREE